MIGLLGLGAAGGNVADEAVKHGFQGIAINYSQRDLDSLEYVTEQLKMHGSEGVGKNRGEAIRLMEKNWEGAVGFVKENFSTPSIEVIIVAFSTGGGSGSGMAPVLLDILMSEMPEKTFVAAPILPDMTEVVANQLNCIRTSEELSQLNVCVLPIDNEQIRKANPGYGKGKLYVETNATFIRLLSEVVSYTDRHSKNGVLDRKDLRAIFNTRGVATMSVVELSRISGGVSDLSEKGIASSIQQSWSSSIFTPIEPERVMRGGIIYDGQESLMEFLNFQTIFKEFKSGMPMDLFEGYYHEHSGGKVYTILTGLSWYSTRLSSIEKVIEERQSASEEMFREEDTYQSKVNRYEHEQKKDKPKRRSASDILSKYIKR